jgi:hypothetical protein
MDAGDEELFRVGRGVVGNTQLDAVWFVGVQCKVGLFSGDFYFVVTSGCHKPTGKIDMMEL